MSGDLLRVLCAEDDADILAVVSLALRVVAGLELETTTRGVEVLDRARRFQPDLIVLDVMMPSKDGPAILADLRETPDLEAIPVVFLTAKVQPAEIERLKAQGALGVIAKPFDPMALGDQLRALWSLRG